MDRTAHAGVPPVTNPADRPTPIVCPLASGLALASFAMVLATQLFGLRLPGQPGWPEALLVIATTLATLAALGRQLPGQNVVLAAVLIAFIGGVAHGVGATTSIPFGPFAYTNNAGPRVFETLAWPVLLIWVVAILNSRGVARLILSPWRQARNYGFRVIGLTTALTLLFDAGLEPFATAVKRYWLWGATGFPVTWQGVPLSNFAGWLAVTLLILALATPALIDKRPRSVDHKPDYHPLAVWLLAMTLFAGGAIAGQLWLAAGFCGFVSLVVTLLVIRGGGRRA